MDTEGWRATVHREAKSQAPLKRLSRQAGSDGGDGKNKWI